jgi:hypothetical protein
MIAANARRPITNGEEASRQVERALLAMLTAAIVE